MPTIGGKSAVINPLPPAEFSSNWEQTHSTAREDMEALPVELLGVILSHVDELTLPCCSAVSRSWTTALLRHRAERAPPLLPKEVFCWPLARAGRLAVLKWARMQGCLWDETVCAIAAIGGHLEVLQW
jgi:hypothetical protein